MKTHFWKVTTLAFAAAFGLSLAMPAAEADRQPRMKDALGHLMNAKSSLQRATSDKGGHRVRAIAAVNEAIEQTRKGIVYDNRR